MPLFAPPRVVTSSHQLHVKRVQGATNQNSPNQGTISSHPLFQKTSGLGVALKHGRIDDMRAVGKLGRVYVREPRGGSTYAYVHATEEETALAWAARHFASAALKAETTSEDRSG